MLSSMPRAACGRRSERAIVWSCCRVAVSIVAICRSRFCFSARSTAPVRVRLWLGTAAVCAIIPSACTPTTMEMTPATRIEDVSHCLPLVLAANRRRRERPTALVAGQLKSRTRKRGIAHLGVVNMLLRFAVLRSCTSRWFRAPTMTGHTRVL